MFETSVKIWFVLLAAVFGCVLSSSAEPVVLSDRTCTRRFVEVDGASRLPLDYMWSGVNEDKLEVVAFPRYWIAEKPVTEGDFASVMERLVRTGRTADAPVTDIEWADALAYCDKLNRMFSRQLPPNTIISIPSMIEWAHAARVLDGKTEMLTDVGTFLFTGSSKGGFLHTYWKGAAALADGDAKDIRKRAAWRFGVLPKRSRSEKVGLRPVIVDITKTIQDMHPIVTRGIVALQHGFYDEARQLLELARTKGFLDASARERVNEAMAFVLSEHDEDMEDWGGLVAVSAAFAEKKGYETEPYASSWQMRGYASMTNASCVAAYRKAHIYGGWQSVCDLPREVRADQAENGTNRVQAISCDFTGDGKYDLIVERLGAVGSYGYWYDFYRRQPDGTYTNIYAVQTVGLCVLPKRAGRGCGFLSVSKCSNPILSVALLTYENGEMKSEPAHERPFCMLDAEEKVLYLAAPFIGGGLGSGWSILEERGVWYRPLFWPWKPGKVLR